jgi:hypothetical protein
MKVTEKVTRNNFEWGTCAFPSKLIKILLLESLLNRTQNRERKLHAPNRYLCEVSPLSNLCLPKPLEWNSWTHLLERCPSSGAWQIKWHLLERHFLSLDLSFSSRAHHAHVSRWYLFIRRQRDDVEIADMSTHVKQIKALGRHPLSLVVCSS